MAVSDLAGRNGHAPSVGQSPTMLRRRLGAELRRLREAEQLTCAQAGERVGWSSSKVSRLEGGKGSIRPIEVGKLLDAFGVMGREKEALVSLAIQAKEPGWWHRYDDVLPEWFNMYLGLEADASLLQIYEPELVTGLLQTEAYARAVLASNPLPEPPDEIERAVALRIGRQRRLRQEPSLSVHAVLNEAAIRRPIGGTEVFRDQLFYLAETAGELVNVTVQVLPFEVGTHAGINGGFHTLEFPDPEDPRIVFIEHLTTSLYLERRREVSRYRLAFTKLCEAALDDQESLYLIRETAKQL